jgi:Raf kinase inhibitor-like YbhB/YbcL family protein
MNQFAITSAAFSDSEAIPAKYTGDGADVSPQLSFQNVPDNTLSFVLIMDDPDAVPVAGFVWDHWIVYDMPAAATALDENAGTSGESNLPTGAKHGTNSWGNLYYQGPAPPSGTHRYYFKMYALNVAELNPAGTTKADIEQAMDGKILGQTTLMGTYSR